VTEISQVLSLSFTATQETRSNFQQTYETTCFYDTFFAVVVGQLFRAMYSLVNEYQLRLGRKRQVWFNPLANERGVCR